MEAQLSQGRAVSQRSGGRHVLAATWRRDGVALGRVRMRVRRRLSRGRRSRSEPLPLSSATRPLLATPNPSRAAHAGPPSICTRSITNLLGSSLEGYQTLMPIEEENSCLAKCWPGSGGEDRAGHHAGPLGDEELAKVKPRQVTPSAARACLRRSLPALAPASPRPTLPRPAIQRASRCTRPPIPSFPTHRLRCRARVASSAAAAVASPSTGASPPTCRGQP